MKYIWTYHNGGWDAAASDWSDYVIKKKISPKCPGCGQEQVILGVDYSYSDINGPWKRIDKNTLEAKHSCGTLIRYVS
jgi:hypothetical protein